jgi:hypothetical protein
VVQAAMLVAEILEMLEILDLQDQEVLLETLVAVAPGLQAAQPRHIPFSPV